MSLKSWQNCDQTTHSVDVEGVGAHKGDGILQVVVVHPILVILVGHHGQSKGSHAVLAPVGQLHLQGDGVPHLAGHHSITVTHLAINQDVCKSRKRVLIRLDTCCRNIINLERRLNQKKGNLSEIRSGGQLILGKKTQCCTVVHGTYWRKNSSWGTDICPQLLKELLKKKKQPKPIMIYTQAPEDIFLTSSLEDQSHRPFLTVLQIKSMKWREIQTGTINTNSS